MAAMFGRTGLARISLQSGVAATVIVSLIAIALAAFTPARAGAVSGSDFVAGNVINDASFYDGAAMTQPEIQTFLDAKIGSCQNGLCLNVLVVDVSNRARIVSDRTGLLRCDAFQGGRLSASEIIYRAQVACGISARVILVTLQKEQGLISKQAPSMEALDRAMGLACSDSAPCAPTALGFGNQIYSAALQLKTYRASKFGMQPGALNIRFNPNAACGSATVSVQNFATAALYNYTPYQPNPAALSTLTGLGDGCSSYGNRNFWVYYNSWFGSSAAAPMHDPSQYVLSIDAGGVLWMYPETGSGTWDSPRQIGSGWNVFSGVFRAGDFAGDGTQAVMARDAAGILWMYGRLNSGLWLPPRQVGSGWGDFTAIVGGYDSTGDGNPDVFARTPAGILWLYPGDGQGGWKSRVQLATGFDSATAIVDAGDFDRNGHPDLLVRDAAGDLWLHGGTGAGPLRPPVKVGSGWGDFSAVFAGGDFNGDGNPDIMARTSDGALLVYPSDGRGGWLASSMIGKGWQSSSIVGNGLVAGSVSEAVTTSPTLPTKPPPATPPTLIAPMTSPDPAHYVLTRDTSGLLWMYPRNADVWSPRILVGNGWSSFTSLVRAGDFSGDKFEDVLARDDAGTLWLYPRDGKGGWGERQPVGTGWNVFTAIAGVGDFNGDGHPDVVARDTAGLLWLYPGDGKGGWLARSTIGSQWNVFSTIIAGGDFNGDGHPDIIARESSALWLYPGSDAGGWLPRVQIGSGWGTFPSVMNAGDINGDGHPDVLAIDGLGNLILYPGDGRGGWLAPRAIGSGWSAMAGTF
ncbi:VCBS repeat-containing protein [Glaciihabitans sp. UYNi722]|uniref:VCBS repeat-containing protein n=1 Tax=Glaciihabitans sp. UYNi722 TaxID=3156344 RepID=UPI00339264D8